MRRWIAIAALTLWAAGPAWACDDEEQPCFENKVLPEMTLGEGHWFNAKHPVTLKSLRGKLTIVVLTSLW